MAVNVRVYSFSEGGSTVADKICSINLKSFRGEKITFTKTKDNALSDDIFRKYDAHIFVGAVGIAVRKIAPFINSKMSDPAVIVVDEKESSVISVLSGHIGGANSLAEIIADFLKAKSIITTATDVNGYNAIDKIASDARLKIKDKESIRKANAKILRGEKVKVYVEEGVKVIPDKTLIYELCEKENADICVFSGGFYVVGVGCRRNIDKDIFSKVIDDVLLEYGINYDDIDRIASIDLKSDEEAILSYIKEHNIMFETYSADELNEVIGDFDESDFVKSVTGVSNVSERACVYAATLMNEKNDYTGNFILKRKAENGVTVSIYRLKKSIDLTGKNNG